MIRATSWGFMDTYDLIQAMPGLSMAQKAVLLVFARCANFGTGIAYPGIRYVAERVGCSPNTASAAVRFLVRAGHLVLARPAGKASNGRMTPPAYRVPVVLNQNCDRQPVPDQARDLYQKQRPPVPKTGSHLSQNWDISSPENLEENFRAAPPPPCLTAGGPAPDPEGKAAAAAVAAQPPAPRTVQMAAKTSSSRSEPPEPEGWDEDAYNARCRAEVDAQMNGKRPPAPSQPRSGSATPLSQVLASRPAGAPEPAPKPAQTPPSARRQRAPVELPESKRLEHALIVLQADPGCLPGDAARMYRLPVELIESALMARAAGDVPGDTRGDSPGDVFSDATRGRTATQLATSDAGPAAGLFGQFEVAGVAAGVDQDGRARS